MNVGELKEILKGCNSEAEVKICFHNFIDKNSIDKGFIKEITYSRGFVQNSRVVDITVQIEGLL